MENNLNPTDPLKDGCYLINILAGGEILTSSMTEDGWGEDWFYYGSENESSRPYERGEFSKSGTVHAQSIRRRRMVTAPI